MSGFYFITVKKVDVAVSGGAKFEHLRVWCDMTTDGGGYTVYAVRGGTPTAKISDANTCQDYGLQLAVPRTAPHLRALVKTFGRRFFKVLPGVYGLSSGNFSALPFNSAVPKVARNWKAVDGGKWFVRAAPLPWREGAGSAAAARLRGGSSSGGGGGFVGKYTPGCWLQAIGWKPGDVR